VFAVTVFPMTLLGSSFKQIFVHCDMLRFLFCLHPAEGYTGFTRFSSCRKRSLCPCINSPWYSTGQVEGIRRRSETRWVKGGFVP